MAATTAGGTAFFAGGYDPEGVQHHELNAVDLFTPDDVAPTAALVSADGLRWSAKSYTFAVSYHDANGVDTNSLGDDDVVVTGPGGFAKRARLVAVARGKHGSTRVATYAVRGDGLRWDATDNGVYTIQLRDGRVSDAAGNAAAGGRVGRFTVFIPGPSPSSGPSAPAIAAATVARAKRNRDDLLAG
jgi:hypothetical protein